MTTACSTAESLDRSEDTLYVAPSSDPTCTQARGREAKRRLARVRLGPSLNPATPWDDIPAGRARQGLLAREVRCPVIAVLARRAGRPRGSLSARRTGLTYQVGERAKRTANPRT